MIGHVGRSGFRPVSASAMTGGKGTGPSNNSLDSSSTKLSSFSYLFLYVAGSGILESADDGGAAST